MRFTHKPQLSGSFRVESIGLNSRISRLILHFGYIVFYKSQSLNLEAHYDCRRGDVEEIDYG
jgi:hypothetical protein